MLRLKNLNGESDVDEVSKKQIAFLTQEPQDNLAIFFCTIPDLPKPTCVKTVLFFHLTNIY